MVTLGSANEALKTVYLGVLANQLNINANPLLGKIKQSTKDVWGREVRKLAPFGINGGIGAGTEEGELPKAGGNNYVQFVSTLKNLYGKIEISDKAVRASANNAGAFVNLLNDEMEGLIKASSFNLGRMLYGDGSGLLATVISVDSINKEVVCDSVRNLIEGMLIEVYGSSGSKIEAASARINYVDRAKNCFGISTANKFEADAQIYVQNSRWNEISGLEHLFSGGLNPIYGVHAKWLKPYTKTEAGEISDALIQGAIDFVEETSGSAINYISCSNKVRRAYQEYLGAFRRNIDIMELAGGYKALTYNGIPVVADRFVADDCMYLLNTNDFTMHQLCDWKWLEGEDGRVLKQNANFPTYSATLVKYAELICDRPNGQVKISGISSTVTNPFITI